MADARAWPALRRAGCNGHAPDGRRPHAVPAVARGGGHATAGADGPDQGTGRPLCREGSGGFDSETVGIGVHRPAPDPRQARRPLLLGRNDESPEAGRSTPAGDPSRLERLHRQVLNPCCTVGSRADQLLQPNTDLLIPALRADPMQDGLVYVDGQVQPEPWLPAASRDSANMPPYIVPAGDVWVLGDHRALREDSSKVGPVPVRSIAGEVRLVWCPWPTSGCCRRGDPARGPTPPHGAEGPRLTNPMGRWLPTARSGRPPTPARPGRRRADRAAPADPWRASRPARQPTAAPSGPPRSPAAGPLRRREQPDCCSPSLRVVSRTEPGSPAGRSWRKRLEGAGLSARRGWPAPHPPRPARGQPLAATG